jgi:NitT/TauT family transport system substrate-binding protein
MLGLAAALCAPAILSQAATAAPEKVVFAWPGVGSSSLAPFAFAQELGYFKAENLQLDTVYLSGSAVVIPQLLNGSIFTSYIALDPLVIARQPGKPNFDIRFAYKAVRNSAWEIAVLDNSPIHTIKDLGGKTIGVGALTFSNVPMTKALLKRAGVTAEMVAVGVGAPGFHALRTGKIDALNLWDVQDTQLEQEGTKIRRIPYPKEFEGVTSHSMPFTNKMIRERPDLIARFGRAVSKGTVACVANPEGCLDAYWKVYPNTKPSDDRAQAIKFEMPLMQARLKNLVYWADGEPHQFGAFSDRDAKVDIESLMAGGLIENPNIDPKTLYTNQFVDEFNKFDTQEVIRQAKAYK